MKVFCCIGHLCEINYDLSELGNFEGRLRYFISPKVDDEEDEQDEEE